MQRIAFFEDDQLRNFFPLTHLRPVFELLCGHFSVRERMLQARSLVEFGAIVRPAISNVYREQFENVSVNDPQWFSDAAVLLVNGRWLADWEDCRLIQPGTTGWIGEEIAWTTIEPGDSFSPSVEFCSNELQTLARQRNPVDAPGRMLHFGWDLISLNAKQLTNDFHQRSRESSAEVSGQVGLVGDRQNLFIHPTAEIDPFVVLDTRHGPIWIEAGAKIQAFTRIEGPSWIGRETQTFRANIREGTSLGPVCRIGGEVEESIVHGFSNKYHDGFLGHSYVCPWVNLGALTSNSDLKNDYSNVSVPLHGRRVQTNSNKVGCFIGDHTKTALCSLFNTGSSIGVMSMILPGGELVPKFIPSFTRIWHGRLEELPDGPESSLQTASYAMGRRNQQLTPAMVELLKHVYEETQPDRELALARETSS